MANPFRIQVQQPDYSGFTNTIVDETGIMVVDSYMGPAYPIKCQNEQDYLLYYGTPNADKWHGFEAISYVRQSPAWIMRAIGTGALYAGVDVISGQTSAVTFGTRSGRDYSTFSPASVNTNVVDTIATATGTTATFTGTLAHSPVIHGSYQLYVAGVLKDSTESIYSGVITGADATGTLTLSNGTYSITFSGTVGTVASYTTKVDFSSTIDLSSGGKPKAVNITIDGVLHTNVSFGSSATTSRASVISALNTAAGYTAASVSTNYIKIDGRLGSTTFGNITIDAPTDTTTYDSALPLIFDVAAAGLVIQDVDATNPTGAVPTANQVVTVDYLYSNTTLATTLSHSFFAFSPYDDSYFQLAATITYISGYQYQLVLYQKIPGRGYNQINTYTYSLIKEKNAFGKSLYIYDIFKNDPYVVPYINPSYTGTQATPSSTTVIVDFTGGNKGATPTTPIYTSAWNNFKYPSKYKGKLLMDVQGGFASTLVDIIQNYQPYAFGITPVPAGNNAAGAIAYRSALGIDFDGVALYTNWATISDPYNGSEAFISQIGKIGVKYAAMIDVFDGLVPAGIDENKHGGQLSGFSVLSMEYDYTEDQQRDLDNAQINPILFDPIYGPMVSGNRTLQVTLSDTSYIHTRRLYNVIIENVVNQVLRKQVFKLNDDLHRLQAASLADEIVNPIVGQGLLNSAIVVCSTANNTPAILNQRKFILDIFVQAAVDSETVLLRLTRLSMTAVLSEIIPQ